MITKKIRQVSILFKFQIDTACFLFMSVILRQ
nr:MAG TPA: hypothetical protein [Caudoviricetes sp.]